MKKSILIGVLCAMLLLAFTACEPQSMDWPYMGEDAKDVMGVSLVTPSDVVLHAGEAFDNIYTGVNILYKDGTSDSNIMAEVSMTGEAKVGQNKMTVKWGGNFDVEGSVIVDALEVTSISLNIENTDNLEKAPETGDVIFIYSDGYEVSEDAVSVKAGTTENTVVYTLEGGTRSTADVTSNEVAYTLKAGPASPEYGDIQVYFSKTDGGYEADAEDLWIGDNVYLEVRNFSTTTSDSFALDSDDFEITVNGVLLSSSQKAEVLNAKPLTSKTGDTYTVIVDGEEIGTVTVPAGKNFMTTNDFDTLFTKSATPVTPGVTVISDSLFTFDAAKISYKEADVPCDDGVVVVSVENSGLIIPTDATGTYPIVVNIESTTKGITTPSRVTVEVDVAE